MRRKLFTFILTVFSMILFSCKDVSDSNHSMPNLKNIKDFTKYTAIGAGTFDESSRTLRSVNNSILIEAADGTKLIGELSDGSLELVTFTDVDGNTTEQTWNLSAFHIDSNFAFLGFTQNNVTAIKSNTLNNGEANYVLDLTNGNLYSVDVFNFSDYYAIGADSYDADGTPVTFVLGTLNDIKGFYTFSIYESKLKIEWKYPVDSLFQISAKSDRYKNIVSDWTLYRYGTLTEKYDPNTYEFCFNEFNNIFYVYDKNEEYNPNIDEPPYKIDEHGDIVANTDNLPFYFSRPNGKIFEEGKDYYRYSCDEGLTPSIRTVTYNNDHSLYSETIDISHDINSLISSFTERDDYEFVSIHSLMNSEDVIVYELNVRVDEKGAITYYKYTISKNRFEELINFRDIMIAGKNVTQKSSDNYVYLWYYDDDYNKIEYYIYSDGTLSNEFHDSSENYTITYLTPIV